jgi:hypothetical protein
MVVEAIMVSFPARIARHRICFTTVVLIAVVMAVALFEVAHTGAEQVMAFPLRLGSPSVPSDTDAATINATLGLVLNTMVTADTATVVMETTRTAGTLMVRTLAFLANLADRN